MRKLIVQQFITVDGFAADTDGGMSFVENHPGENDRGFIVDAKAFINTVDTMLLGANTYTMFVTYWPTAAAKDDPIAGQLNALDKYVVSADLQEAPWGDYPKATVLHQAAEGVRELKAMEGKRDIVLWGSLTLAQHLEAQGLVDEYCLRVCPAATGDGKRLFARPIELELLESKGYEQGIVVTRYKPLR